MPTRGAETLAYAVRGFAVARFLGEFCRALAGVALVPAIFAAATGDWQFAGRAAIVTVLLIVGGSASMRLPSARSLQVNEAMVIVALGYLVCALMMSWPLAIDGVTAIDAVFHSMSAITTTGLSTIGGIGSLPPSFLFAQAWMQWCGGLVVIVLALLLMEPGPAAQRLSDVDQEEFDLVAGTRQRARWALSIYSALTALGFMLLMVLGCGWFDALVHALSALSTGGFSSHGDSIAGLGGWPAEAGVTMLALAGAVPLARYRALVRSGVRPRARLARFFDQETLVLLGLAIGASVLLGVTMTWTGDIAWHDAALAAPLLAVSAQSTAGFTPIDIGRLGDASKSILIAAMFIGGGTGSTAGGIKVMRLLLLLRIVAQAVQRPSLPAHAVVKLQVGGRRLSESGLLHAIGIVACFGGVILASWFAFLLHGYDALDAMFEVVSATATVGLSSGLSASSLEPGLKLVLCADMWMGRLEVLAVLVLLSRRTWFGRRAAGS
jgi:trk system potassium uptake protein TrkH